MPITAWWNTATFGLSITSEKSENTKTWTAHPLHLLLEQLQIGLEVKVRVEQVEVDRLGQIVVAALNTAVHSEGIQSRNAARTSGTWNIGKYSLSNPRMYYMNPYLLRN